MSFCTKCGKELNDGDLFCSNCGARVIRIENSTIREEDYSNNTNNIEEIKKAHPCSIAAFVLSIIGLVLTVIILSVAIKYAATGENASRSVEIIYGLLIIVSILLTLSALPTAIIGFACSTKRKMKSKINTAAFVLAIILASLYLVIYVIG